MYYSSRLLLTANFLLQWVNFFFFLKGLIWVPLSWIFLASKYLQGFEFEMQNMTTIASTAEHCNEKLSPSVCLTSLCVKALQFDLEKMWLEMIWLWYATLWTPRLLLQVIRKHVTCQLGMHGECDIYLYLQGCYKVVRWTFIPVSCEMEQVFGKDCPTHLALNRSDEKHSHSMMLPAPCFTAGVVWAEMGFHQTPNCVPRSRNKMLVSSQ